MNSREEKIKNKRESPKRKMKGKKKNKERRKIIGNKCKKIIIMGWVPNRERKEPPPSL